MALNLTPSIAASLKRVKLVLMDVDGTLVTSDQTTFTRVVEQLRGLKSVGVQFSIATGRTLHGVTPILRAMADVGAKAPPVITYNGAVVALLEGPLVLKIRTIERAAFGKLVRCCRARGNTFQAYCCTATPFGLVHETTFTEAAAGPAQEFNGSSVHIVEDLTQLDEDFVAVLVDRPAGCAGEALLADLSSRFAGVLRVTTSGGPYIEICHPEGTKLNAMVELAGMLGVEADEIMAIGDNYNDLEMIEAAGIGVAVANSPTAVREAAALTCTREGAQGVVEALRMLARVIRTNKALTAAFAKTG